MFILRALMTSTQQSAMMKLQDAVDDGKEKKISGCGLHFSSFFDFFPSFVTSWDFLTSVLNSLIKFLKSTGTTTDKTP